MSIRASTKKSNKSSSNKGTPIDTLLANADPILTWMSYISMLYSGITFISHISAGGEEANFAGKNLLAFFYAGTWLILVMFHKVRFEIPSKKRYATILIAGGIVSGITFFIQFFIGIIMETQVFYSVFPIEIMFYYINMAIAETILWNMGIHILMMNIAYFLLRIDKRPGKDSAKKFIAVIITNLSVSLLFAMTHYNVYQGNPVLLGSMFLGMSMWELFHELIKSPLVALVPHLLLNAIVGGIAIVPLIFG